MPLRYRIEDGVVHVTLWGSVTAAENYTFAHTWLNDPERRSPILLCRDSSELDGSQTAADMRDFAELFRRIVDEIVVPPGSRVALVARGDLQYGLLRVVSGHADAADVPISVFRSVDEAVVWLKQAEPADPG